MPRISFLVQRSFAVAGSPPIERTSMGSRYTQRLLTNEHDTVIAVQTIDLDLKTDQLYLLITRGSAIQVADVLVLSAIETNLIDAQLASVWHTPYRPTFVRQPAGRTIKVSDPGQVQHAERIYQKLTPVVRDRIFSAVQENGTSPFDAVAALLRPRT